jgi:hypothetical protein
VTPEDLYLRAVINRLRLSPEDPGAPGLLRRLTPLLHSWGGDLLESVALSGSLAKGTALRGGDVDVFLSLSPRLRAPLAAVHASLLNHFRDFLPQPRNVSLRIRFEDRHLDLVPGRGREGSTHHTLWQVRRNTWLQTDVAEQIRYVRLSGRLDEILALKIWRRRHGLRFPSFCLELAVIHALSSAPRLPLAASFLEVLRFLATDFPSARLLDPANSNNLVSDTLSEAERCRIAGAARISLNVAAWTEIL